MGLSEYITQELVESVVQYGILVAITSFVLLLLKKAVFADKVLTIEETGQVVIIILLSFVIYVDGTREHEWPHFGDMTRFIFILGVFFLSGLSNLATLILNIKNPFNGTKNKSNTDDSDSRDNPSATSGK